MSFSRLLRFFSNPFSITSSNSSAPEKEESSSNSNEPKKEESSSNSSAPKIMVSTSTSSIALLGVMLMASSTFIYYLYSRASSSNSSASEKEESSSNSSASEKEESSSNSSEPKIMLSTSTSSIQTRFKYDVFLSFRGEDTRKNFVDHLYHALQDKCIVTYMDDVKINRGKTIDNKLILTIKDSRFFIIVFSQNYASSSWCLNELVQIMECQRTGEQTAYPVFYDVEPREVRKQGGAVGEAFSKHENQEAAGKWRDTMKELTDLDGWDLKVTANGHESKLIQIIVDAIFKRLHISSDPRLQQEDKEPKIKKSSLASTSTSNSFVPKIKKSSDEKRFKYDVFLSFRGEDTRKNFVDHLYEALKDKGIYTYKDDVKIKKGKRISDDLIKAIEDSKFYIIVFSKNYASSSWCLEELVKIMECQKMTGHTAYPVFYDVEPTEVRKQSGAVGKAFAKHEKEVRKKKMGVWISFFHEEKESYVEEMERGSN